MHWRWPLAALAAALTLTTAPAASGAPGDPPAAAGWHGREIRDPVPERVRAAVARFPRGWSAGSVGAGSGFARPDGSRRVRAVQRELLARGYRPGRLDGRFGPRTRAAVIWFQIKHRLPRTGRVDARGLAALRQRPHARTPATAQAPTPTSRAKQHTQTLAGPERADWTWLVLLLVATIVGLAAIARWLHTQLRRHPPAVEAGPQRHAQLTAAATPPAHAPVNVIGYLAVPRGGDRDRALDTATEIISSWCQSRDWQLTQIIHDTKPTGGRLTDRPGLAYALDQIAAGRVTGLVLAHLADLARSATELAQLLQWLNHAGAFMIALDYELDTSTAAGELATNALIRVGDWERTRIADRTRPGLTAIRAQATTTKPNAVIDNPALSARINTMRAQGQTLQAICDTLNAEGVPTLRGGTHWRPSSVQAATGYKRPPAKTTTTQGRWDHDPT